MENLQDRVYAEKNGLQRFLEKLPGVSEYVKKENIRDIDRVVRERTGAQFEEQWQRIQSIAKTLAKGTGIAYLSDLDSAAKKVRLFADKIRTAPNGYAGVTDALKVGEASLNQLYDYDLYLLSLTDTLKSAVDKVETAANADEGLEKAIRELDQIAGESLTALNQRQAHS